MASTTRARGERGASETGVSRPSPGRVERRVQEALRAGHGGDKADRRFVAVEAVALTLGRALDGASERGDGQQVGRLSRYLMEALRELRLTPATAADGSGPEDTWEAFARAMATPEVVYPTGAPVPWESPDARDRAG